MTLSLMDAERARRLAAEPLTYAPAGVSLSDEEPVRRWQRRVGTTSRDFARASRALRTWRAHTGAGLDVVASSAQVEVDSVVELYLGVGRLAVRAPCRVVAVVDEPRRRGFAYGTLPGHPESGEEAFLVEDRGGEVMFTVDAVSRPASRAARIAGPLTRVVQNAIARRYLHALMQ